jgi:hypothetical protein
MKRRAFLKAPAALAAATSPLTALAAPKAAVIDTNVYLGRCPFRRLPLDEPAKLAAGLQSTGVTQAWVAPFESLLHRDLDPLNGQLAETCRSFEQGGFFIPIGAINPKLPGWRETLRRCVDIHKMPAIRLHPGHNNYPLDDPALLALLGEAQQRNVLVQIALLMEDPRTQHPRVIVPAVDPSPLLTSLPELPNLRVQLTNSLRSVSHPKLLASLAKLNVHFEISMLEGMAGVKTLLTKTPGIPVCYGSYAPFFYPLSAALKVKESQPELTGAQVESLVHGHAGKLIPS